MTRTLFTIPGVTADRRGVWNTIASPTQVDTHTVRKLGGLVKKTTTTPKQVHRYDFTMPSIMDAADQAVTATMRIATSETVRNGSMGNPRTVQDRLIDRLFTTVHTMLDTEKTVLRLENLRANGAPINDNDLATLLATTVDNPVANLKAEADSILQCDAATAADMAATTTGTPAVPFAGFSA